MKCTKCVNMAAPTGAETVIRSFHFCVLDHDPRFPVEYHQCRCGLAWYEYSVLEKDQLRPETPGEARRFRARMPVLDN